VPADFETSPNSNTYFPYRLSNSLDKFIGVVFGDVLNRLATPGWAQSKFIPPSSLKAEAESFGFSLALFRYFSCMPLLPYQYCKSL
jgi:hypothetical protein